MVIFFCQYHWNETKTLRKTNNKFSSGDRVPSFSPWMMDELLDVSLDYLLDNCKDLMLR
jgi:hypothetical protein